ncbi:hypothetical protein [Pseudocitrobacter vendiensis]|uniref:TIGR02646 family protein n=1 Tax=Pseudocitrobacter vendiensis TaxID=2488306 RepID=A0ABM9FDP5_9ENTR|nr:hypothetical protein [Pseudocitrobacter vendiensis]CAH6661359.1 hypothetical protein FBBNIHIM_19820 [Pseudocitrobacter vendiensis]
MYAFHRSQCPDYLAECWERLGRHYEAQKLHNQRYRFKWFSGFRYATTKQKLYEMTQGHCAFCDGGCLGAESRMTLEHFKPKSRRQFYRLAYQWENLYPCCDTCQSQKKNGYDAALLVGDQPGYAFIDYFWVNYVTGELKPNPLSAPENQRRAEVTIAIYGLNLDVRKISRKRELRHFHHRDGRLEFIDDFSYRYFLIDA